MTSNEKVTVDLAAWARKWKNRREGLVMRAAIIEIERLRAENLMLRSRLPESGLAAQEK